MNNNWAEVRQQMDQVLEWERAQHRAQRRQQPSLTQSLKLRWQAIVDTLHGQKRLPASEGRHTPHSIDRQQVAIHH